MRYKYNNSGAKVRKKNDIHKKKCIFTQKLNKNALKFFFYAIAPLTWITWPET